MIENCHPEKCDMASFLHLTQVAAICDVVRVGSTITNCKIGFKKCGLFPRNQEEVLNKSGIKKSSKSFIGFTACDHSPIKISGHCIIRDDVIDNLRKKKEIEKKKKGKRGK